MAKRISVINFKGGVGKTTFSFNLAAGLARYYNGKRVLLVDVDHQSSLSIVCLGATRWESSVEAKATTTEIFKTFTGARPALPGEEIITKAPLALAQYSTLDIAPASLELDDVEIELTSTHKGNAIQSEWQKRTLICEWLEKSSIDAKYDYIIFDCPPATKIVAQNAIAASHGYIIPVVPEAVMERGAPHLVEMVKNGIDKRLVSLSSLGERRKLFVRNTKLVGLVVTRITHHGPAASGYTDDHTTYLRSLQRRWGSDLLKPYIASGTGVSQTLADGYPVYDYATNQNIGRRGIHTEYQHLTHAVKAKIDLIR